MNQFLLFIETHLVTGSKFQVWPWYRLAGSAHRKRTPLHSLSPASLHVPLAHREEGEGDSMQRCHRYWKKHSKPSLDSTVSQQNSGLNRSWVDVHLRPSLPLTGFVTLTGINKARHNLLESPIPPRSCKTNVYESLLYSRTCFLFT